MRRVAAVSAPPSPVTRVTLRGPLRVARAAVLGAAALGLAAAAHAASGGGLPSWPTLALLSVPVAWLGVLLTGRTLGLPTTLAELGAAQAGLHTAFMALAPGGCTPALPGGPMAGMHGGGVGLAVPTGCTAPSAMAHDGMAHDGMAIAAPAWMTFAHVVATAATALLLARGERLLVSLTALLLGLFIRWGTVTPVLLVVRRLVAGLGDRTLSWRRSPSLRTRHRRGPPVLACAAAS
jgi:hypothetical protein